MFDHSTICALQKGRKSGPGRRIRPAFTLIELLTVVAIISMLISIMMPSLARARAQAKGVHCLARLREFGTAIATYMNDNDGLLPTAEYIPPNVAGDVRYGWAELLFQAVYGQKVLISDDFPCQRNVQDRWQRYFNCKTATQQGVHSGHYRVYLPAWCFGNYRLGDDDRYDLSAPIDPTLSSSPERVPPLLPMMGDSNPLSWAGDGKGDDDVSYIDAGEANEAGPCGTDGNRFDDRHYGGVNFLFADSHAERSTKLRDQLARDFDLNGIDD